jgi:hypothetical protein
MKRGNAYSIKEQWSYMLCAAINATKEQKSVSLEKRAEATYAEYRRQKKTAPEGQGFRHLFGRRKSDDYVRTSPKALFCGRRRMDRG